MANAQAAIATRLTTDATVAGIVGEKVRPVALRQDEDLPGIVYEVTATRLVNHLNGSAGIYGCTMSVDALDTDYDRCWTLARAIITALSGWKSAESDPPIKLVHVEDAVDVPENPEQGRDWSIYRVSIPITVTLV